MAPITAGQIKIIPTLEGDGYALPGGNRTTSRDEAKRIADRLNKFLEKSNAPSA